MSHGPAVLAADVRPAAHATDDGGTADRVVFVHGFTQTRRSWDGVREVLADRYETVAVDAPGHGESGHLKLSMAEGAEALGAAGGTATYAGYSMGARLALHLAVARPDLVERLVLVSGTAGLDTAAERTARVASDDVLASEIERDGVAAFVERWLALPLFAGLPRERAGVAERLTNTAAGLASSLRLAGTGAQEPLWDRLGELSMPVLLVVGADDAKFVAIGERLHGAITGSHLVVVPGGGHTVHLEQPERFTDALTHWLDGSSR